MPKINHNKHPLLVICLAVSLISGLAVAEDGLGPSLSVDPGPIDLGTLDTGQIIHREIPIANVGDAELLLTDYYASCSCAKVSGPAELQPGETGKIQLTLNTMGLEGPGGTDISFQTNDSAAPTVLLIATAEIKSYLKMHPARNRFLTVQGEPGGEIENRLVAKDGSDFDILSVESPYPFLDVTFEEVPTPARDATYPGGQWLLRSSFPTMAPVGPLTGAVSVTTNHPKEPKIDLPLSGFVRPRFSLTPPSLSFNEVVLDGPKNSPFWFKSFSEEPIVVTGVETDVEGITINLKDSADGRQFLFYLHFTEALPEGDFAGTLTITTDSEQEAVLKYPLTGTIVRPSDVGGASAE